jgi:CRP-like cAMP-binding protein
VTSIEIMMPGRPPLSLRCSGCWQQEEPSAELMLTGISFDDPDESDLDAIWDFVLDSGKYLARFLLEKSEIHELGLDDAMSLSQMTRYRDIPMGHILYRQNTNEPGQDGIYLLLEGTVILEIRVRDARDVEFERLQPGQFFGGLPILADVPHAESATAATDVRLLEIDRHSFQSIRTAKPWLGYRLGTGMLRISSARLGSMMSRVCDLL